MAFGLCVWLVAACEGGAGQAELAGHPFCNARGRQFLSGAMANLRFSGKFKPLGSCYLCVHGSLDEIPSWFPDGKHLAFQSNPSGRTEVWVMDSDGTHLRQITGIGAR